MVHQRITFDRGEDPGRNGQAYRQSQGKKGEQERGRHTLDDERQRRVTVKKRLPKISLYRTPNERAILHDQWFVEPQSLAQGGAGRFWAIFLSPFPGAASR